LGCPVFVGPKVVDGAVRVVVAVVACPVAAVAAVERSAVVASAAQASVSFIESSIGKKWLPFASPGAADNHKR
jgi:hypothetical protein